MSKNSLPDPKSMATSEEEIAALFGAAVGEALVLAEGEIVVVLTASGQVIWLANGKELDPEMVAKLISFLMNVANLKSIVNKYKLKSSISEKIRPKNFVDSVSVENPSATPGSKGNKGYSR